MGFYHGVIRPAAIGAACHFSVEPAYRFSMNGSALYIGQTVLGDVGRLLVESSNLTLPVLVAILVNTMMFRISEFSRVRGGG